MATLVRPKLPQNVHFSLRQYFPILQSGASFVIMIRTNRQGKAARTAQGIESQICPWIEVEFGEGRRRRPTEPNILVHMTKR
jgi:hypothetical protein